MLTKKIISIVMDSLGIDLVEAQKNNKALPEIDSFYFWSSQRGGKSIIINVEGEKLIAPSSVSFENHLHAFSMGKRN